MFFMGINNEIYYNEGKGRSTAANKFPFTTRLVIMGWFYWAVLLYPALSEATDFTS